MARTAPALRALTAALLLSACSSAGGFERPLVEGGVLTREEARRENKRENAANSFSSVNEDPYHVDTDYIQYRENTYRLRDLDPGERPALDTDEAGLWMISDRLERQIQTSGNLIRDPEINAYLRELTCKLAAEYCDDIRIYLSQTPHFNAFMAPNGVMNTWTGLLLRVDNEAQLAAVIAHEIGHYLRRHSVQQFRDARDKSNVGAFLAVGLGAVGAVAHLALVGTTFAYQRDMERESDGYSLLLMARAGYDPREAHKIWARILKEKEADEDAGSGPTIYSSHPPSKERRDALADLGQKVFDKLGADKIEADRFRSVIAPYKTELLNDEVSLRNFDRSMALFDMLIESNPNPAEIIFFKGELHRVRGDADENDDTKALEFYEQALTAMGTPPADLYRSRGLLHRRMGDNAASAAAFRHYLELAPESVDRPFIENFIRELETS